MSARVRRFLAWGAVALVIAVLWMMGAVSGPPLDARTITLAAFLRQEGVTVDFAEEPGLTNSTSFLLEDYRAASDEDALLAWVRNGGTLVVADPASELLPSLQLGPGDLAGGFGDTSLRPACITPQTEGIASVQLVGYERTISSDDPHAVSCFLNDQGEPFMVRMQQGSGVVVVMGGTSPLEDRMLQESDNAAFALRLVGPHKHVTFLPSVSPGASAKGGFWSTMPQPLRVAALQLLIALLVYSFVRGRRLGRIPDESPLTPISANELVRARAGLYRHARARGHAANKVRGATRARILARVGGEIDEPVASMAHRVAVAVDLEASDVVAAYDASDVADDVQLTTKERVMEHITRTTEGAP